MSLSRRRGKIRQVEPLDQPGCPGRQGVEYPLQVVAEIVLARLDFREQARCFLGQRRRDHRQRQDDDRDNDQNGDRGRKAWPVVHRLQQPSIDRRKNHRHDDRPENGAIERLQNPGERQRDGDKQQQKTLMFDPLHGLSRFTFARPILRLRAAMSRLADSALWQS